MGNFDLQPDRHVHRQPERDRTNRPGSRVRQQHHRGGESVRGGRVAPWTMAEVNLGNPNAQASANTSRHDQLGRWLVEPRGSVSVVGEER